MTGDERYELVLMSWRRENRVLRRERQLLSRAAAIIARDGVRPSPEVTFAFTYAEKASFLIAFMCVRLGCRVLGISRGVRVRRPRSHG